MFLRPPSGLPEESRKRSVAYALTENRSPVIDKNLIDSVRKQCSEIHHTAPRGKFMDIAGVEKPIVEMKLPEDIVVSVIGDTLIPFAKNHHSSITMRSGDPLTIPKGTLVRMNDQIIELIASADGDTASRQVKVWGHRLYRGGETKWINFKDCPGYAPSGLQCAIGSTQAQVQTTTQAELLHIISTDINARNEVATGKFVEPPKAA